ncbi:hypothetical protein AB9M62_43600 [Bacillales bacterium AN1005]
MRTDAHKPKKLTNKLILRDWLIGGVMVVFNSRVTVLDIIPTMVVLLLLESYINRVRGMWEHVTTSAIDHP